MLNHEKIWVYIKYNLPKGYEWYGFLGWDEGKINPKVDNIIFDYIIIKNIKTFIRNEKLNEI